jgi:hypothetical protein
MGGYNRVPTGEGDYQQMAAIFLGTGYAPGSGLPLFRHRLTIRSVENMDLLGFSLAFIGDINGDQCDELVVGIPRHDRPGLHDSGRVSFFLGMPWLVANPPDPIPAPATILSSAAQAPIDGQVDEGWFGASLATAQDANGNLLKDLLIGAPGNGPVNAGNALLGSVYQVEMPTILDVGVLATAQPGVAIAANPIPPGTPGISGSPQWGYVLTAHRILQGSNTGDRFGAAVAFVGDLDGAAGQEFLVGAPQYAPEMDGFLSTGMGYARLFRLGSLTPLVQINGTQPLTIQHGGIPYGEAFGFSLAGGLDIGSPAPLGTIGPPDGVPDLVIGSPLFNVDASIPNGALPRSGRVRAFSVDLSTPGSPVVTPLLVDSPPVNGTVMFGANHEDQFGYSVAAILDVNGDTRPDIMGGAWQGAIDLLSTTHCPSTPSRTALGGYAFVYSPGSPNPQTPILKFYGEKVRDHMGRAVAAANLYGTSSRPEIVLSGLGWSPAGAVSGVNTDLGKGFVWDGDTVMFP